MLVSWNQFVVAAVNYFLKQIIHNAISTSTIAAQHACTWGLVGCSFLTKGHILFSWIPFPKSGLVYFIANLLGYDSSTTTSGILETYPDHTNVPIIQTFLFVNWAYKIVLALLSF